MNRASQDKLIQRFRIVSRGAGMIVALVGGMVLIGWVGDITELTNILPDYVAMKANTAIAFLLSGIALWLLREDPPTTPLRTTMGRACALLALMLGLLTLAEYVSNIPLGIDEALFRDSQSAVQTSHPGRMAPNSAANFVLLGLALLLADFGHTRWFRPSEFLALTAFGIAMLPFTGYLYGVSSLVGYTHRYTTMAIHTSAAFLVLSTGILFMRTNRGWMQLVTSGGAAGLIMRLLFPLTVIMLVVLGWLRLAGEQAGFYTSESGTSVFVLIRIVLIGAIIAGVARVVHHLERVRDAAQEDLERANRGLEQRVQQRTREVEESNRALVEEVQHRARVEQALRESESRLQAILHGSPVAQFVIDRDHSVISWNRPLEEYTGIKAETMLGTSQQWRAFYPSERPCLADLLLEGEREQMRQWYGSKVTPSELVEGAYEATDFFPNLGDAGRWLYFMAAVIRGPEGDVIGAVETLRDITDRKRAEEARYLDEQRLDALLRLNQMTRASMKELTDFALEEAVRLTKSKIGYLAFMNEDESVLTMYSWSRSAMSQCTVQEKPIVYPVRDTGLWGEAVRQRRPVITNDYTVPSPLKKGFPEGHVPILRHMNIPVMDEGRIVAVAGVGNKDEPYDESDTRQLTLLMEGMWRILQRRRTEDAIRHMRAYLQNVVDSMPSVLVGIDLDGAVTHWNREAARLTGMEEADVKGRDFGDVLPQLQGQLEKVRAAIREGQALENERFGARNSEQDMRFYDLMVYPLIANGTQGAVLRLDDVTSRVQIEEMMVQTEKMMSVGGLAAGMAHEINNPLGGILQACQNIERRTSLDLAKNVEVAQALGIDLGLVHQYLRERGILEFVAGIRSDGARAARIVSDMLAFSRRSTSQMASVDLGEAVETVLRLAANDYDLKKQYDFRNIQIVRDFESNLPPVQCDKTKIEQVLLNLVKNAAQALATRDKTIAPVITVRLAREPRHLRIEVSDNGPGMDETIRRRAFEPFFTTKEVGVGTGLGLSVSYFIITRQHKGTMSVESGPGEGSRFIIRLPFRAEG